MGKIQYCPNTQKLWDMFNLSGQTKYLRIKATDGSVYEALADCWTSTEYDGDEDADALRFIMKDGTPIALAGGEIESYELIED